MVVIWLLGLPASGKTTIGNTLRNRLEEKHIAVQMLDGDELRKTVSSDLGFTKQDRETHAKRVIDLAAKLSMEKPVVIVSLITPYQSSRNLARETLTNYFEVWVKASVEECMRRDPKGLYKKAFANEILNFTGVQDPFEIPQNPDIILDTEQLNPDRCVTMIIKELERLRYLPN